MRQQRYHARDPPPVLPGRAVDADRARANASHRRAVTATHACARARNNLRPAPARHATSAPAHGHPVREHLQGQVHRHDVLHVRQHQLQAERVLGFAQRPVLCRWQVARQPDTAPTPAADTATADTTASNTGNTTTD